MTMFPIASTPSRWRDPRFAWRAMQVVLVFAFVLYAVTAVAVVVSIAYDAGAFPDDAYLLIDAFFLIDASFGALGVAITIESVAWFAMLLILTSILVGNARSTGDHRELPSPTMAMATYFIPIANVFLPAQMMGNLWRATLSSEPGGRIAWWWASVIACGALSMAGAIPAVMENYELNYASAFASYITAIIAAVLTWRVFGALVKAQRRPTP